MAAPPNEKEVDSQAGYSWSVYGKSVPRKPTQHPIVEGQFSDTEDIYDGEALFDANQPNEKHAVAEAQVLPARVDDFETVQVDSGEGTASEDEDDSDEYEDDFNDWEEKTGPNCQSKQKCLQTSDELFRKFSSKISVEKYEGVDNLPSGAGNKILAHSKHALAQRVKIKDKQDRATVEQVLDPRTRMIVYKLLSTGKILSIDGCISTGKEANVYHATGPQDTALAIKIYKTSILTFKARDKYVSGEFRFRQGYCKKNPRKMVRVWAEKEFRNLLRIHTSGTINVPHPKVLKSHVLVMDFIGEDGWPCPLLKDVKFGELELEQNDNDTDPVNTLVISLYRQCLLILYRLFKHCKLVHADFSEFNLILKKNKDLFVIDVSQSVEHDHPRSLDFLRHDIKNVQEFFGKLILVGDYKDIFEFITSPNVSESNYESVLEDILKNAKQFESFNVADEVFRQTHIPRKMQEVVDYERDYEKMKKGETELVYTKIMGMKSDMSGPDMVIPGASEGSGANMDESEIQRVPTAVAEVADRNTFGDEEESDSDSETEEEEKDDKGNVVRPKNETAEEKRLRKKQVKDEKAEKRKSKVKKHVKKRKEKMAHTNSKR